VRGDEGQKFHSNARARTRNSADISVPWKYWPLKQPGRETSSTNRPYYGFDARGGDQSFD
jgi:hypothetical protein